MFLASIPNIIYHGTTSNYLSSIIQGINLSYGNKWADFGQGFYTTSNFIQSLNWARKRRDSYNEVLFDKKDFVDGIIIAYELDLFKLHNLNGKMFEYPSFEWARFIYKNRDKEMNYKHNYDYIYGFVADGKVDELINELISDKIGISKFRKSIIHKNKNNQMSFHTLQTIECLKFLKVVKYDEEIRFNQQAKR